MATKGKVTVEELTFTEARGDLSQIVRRVHDEKGALQVDITVNGFKVATLVHPDVVADDR